METNILLYKKLTEFKSTLPQIILQEHFKLRTDLAKNYTEHQKENYKKDVSWILSFLAESVRAGQPVLFQEFVLWLKTFLSSVRIPMKDVAESFQLIKTEINKSSTPDEIHIISTLIDKSIDLLLSKKNSVSLPAQHNQLNAVANEYLENLLKGRRNEALSLIMTEVKSGTPLQEIYINVFQPVQYEIGRLWQTNKISVAQEHYCTAATQMIMAQLYPYLFTGERREKKMVVTCVPGELHEMGARVVADFFEMNGWDTYYLGANMPISGVIKSLSDVKPECNR